jgi:hypothetical protein
VPDTRSRSTVLTDSFNNFARSSWVSSGCISDRRLQQASLPVRSRPYAAVVSLLIWIKM